MLPLRRHRLRKTPTRRRRSGSLRSLGWLNFFLADVQTGLGPFLAAYLAFSGWSPRNVGFALTFGGLVTVAMQTPAGGMIDAARRKRLLVAGALGVLVGGAFLLMLPVTKLSVYAAQLMIGASGPFLGPTVAAITLGLVGAAAFDKQFGKNQSFNSSGNVFTRAARRRRELRIRLSRDFRRCCAAGDSRNALPFLDRSQRNRLRPRARHERRRRRSES
jgi:hypothetical protein